MAQGTSQPGRLVGLACTMATLMLVGCSTVPDEVNPIEWYKGTRDWVTGVDEQRAEAETKAESGRPETPVTGTRPEGETFPDIDDAPRHAPRVTPAAEREAMKRGLVADRENARYSSDDLAPTPPPSARPPAAAAPVSRPADEPGAGSTPAPSGQGDEPSDPPAALPEDGGGRTAAPPSPSSSLDVLEPVPSAALRTGAASPPRAATSGPAQASRQATPQQTKPPQAMARAAAPTGATAVQPVSARAISGRAEGWSLPGLPPSYRPSVPLPGEIGAPPPPDEGGETVVISSTTRPTPDRVRRPARAGASEARRRPAGSGAARPTVVADSDWNAWPADDPSVVVYDDEAALTAGPYPEAAPAGESYMVGAVRFASGSAQLSGEGRMKIREAAAAWREHGGRMRVVGFAASGQAGVGRKLADLDLSSERAGAVVDELLRSGVSADAVVSDAVADGRTPQGTAAAPRAEIYLDY